MRLLLVLPLLLLAACGSTSADGTAAPSSPPTQDSLAGGGGIAQADDDLSVEYDAGDGTPVATWTLTCVGVVEGSHPDAEAACAHLQALEQPFAPLPADIVCTQQYGGPQTARVSGRWGGEPVDLTLSRIDGCRISQWEGLVPLVPAAT